MSDTASGSRGPVHRAFGLLQLVVAAGEPVGVRDLARRSGLSRSTTGRMLGILTELGMVDRTPDGAAAPGAGLATLTTEVDRSAAMMRDRLRPLTLDLMQRFGENAAIGVDAGAGLLYVDSARLDTAVQVADPVGHRFDFHLVAPGLIAMTAWSDDRLAEYLSGDLAAATTYSVTATEAIRSRLDAARHAGFIWTDQELDVDVNGLAAPVRNTAGAQVAVATLYGPSYRLAPANTPDLGAQFADFVTRWAERLAI